MKHFFLAIALCATVSLTANNAVMLHTFESGITNPKGEFFVDDSGHPSSSLVTNPKKSGINTSDKVVAVNVGTSSGLMKINFQSGIAPQVAYPANPYGADALFYDRLRFKYYKGNLTNRYVELEPNGSPTSPKTIIPASGNDEWEYIDIPLTNKTYNNFQIRINRNEAGNGGATGSTASDVIYVDDFELYNSIEGPSEGSTEPPVVIGFPQTFENGIVNPKGEFFVNDPGHPASSLAVNPKKSGINTGDKVVAVNVGTTSGLMKINFADGTTPKIDYPTHPTGADELYYDILRFKYYKGTLTNRYVEFEPNGTATNPKTIIPTSGNDEWEYITINLTNKTYNNFQIRINRNDAGNGAATGSTGSDVIYVDDFELLNSNSLTTNLHKIDNKNDFSCITMGSNSFKVVADFSEKATVRIDLISVDGRVSTLYNQVSAGALELPFQVQNSGLYFVRMTVNNVGVVTKKIINN